MNWDLVLNGSGRRFVANRCFCVQGDQSDTCKSGVREMRASGTDMPAMVRRLFQHWNLQKTLLRDRVQEVGRGAHSEKKLFLSLHKTQPCFRRGSCLPIVARHIATGFQPHCGLLPAKSASYEHSYHNVKGRREKIVLV